MCTITSKHWCRGTGDCCMVCTIHTHEAKVVASMYYRACLTYGLLYVTHTLTYSFVQMRDLYELRPRRRATRAINVGQFDIKFSPLFKIIQL